MNSTPMVSVIIPTHNRPILTVDAVKSALAQEDVSLEVIVVDDASTDETPDRVAQILDPRVKLVRLPRNLGSGGARNVAIGHAKGEFVAFLDSDDRWLPNKLKLQLNRLRDAGPPYCMIHCRRAPFRSLVKRNPVPTGFVTQHILADNFVAFSSSLVYRKSLLALSDASDSGPFNTSLSSCEDWDLWIRLARTCAFAFLDVVLVIGEPLHDSLSLDKDKTVTGHLEIDRLHAHAIAHLPKRLRGLHHMKLARDFWWKRDLHHARVHLVKAVSAWPPLSVSFLLEAVRRLWRKRLVIQRPPFVVLQLIEHFEIGGAERVVADLCKHLNRKRYAPIACVYRWQDGSAGNGPIYRELELAKIPVVYLRKEVFPERLRVRLLRPMLTALESPLFVLRLAWLLYSKHIALVHCHVFSAGLWGRLAAPLARLLGVPARVIFTEHNWYKKSTSRKRYWLNRLLAPLADKVVGVSPEVGRAIKDMYHLPEQQVRVIENGVALPHPNTKKPDMPYDLLGDVCRPCVISVCRLVADKRLDIWLRAFALLPGHLQAVAWIVGDGPERLRLEALARDLQIDDKIRFLGLRYDIPALLSHATVFLNTSDREGLPISVLEAAAAGVPIVASAVGGTPKIVQNGHTGLLISPGSPESAAKAVQSLLEEPQLAHQLATEARKLVYQKYSLEDNANNWMLLYDDILLENCGIAPSGV